MCFFWTILNIAHNTPFSKNREIDQMNEGYIQRDMPVDVSRMNMDDPIAYNIPVGNGIRKLQSITIHDAYSSNSHTIYAFCRNVPSLNTNLNVTDSMDDFHDYVRPYIEGPYLKSFVTFCVRDTTHTKPHTIKFSADALQLDRIDVVDSGLTNFLRYFEPMQSPSLRGIRSISRDAYIEKVREKLKDITPDEYSKLVTASSDVDLVESVTDGVPMVVVTREYDEYQKLVKVLFDPKAFDAGVEKQNKIKIRKDDHLDAMALVESYRASMGYIKSLELVLYHNSPIRKYTSRMAGEGGHSMVPMITSRTYATSYGNPHKTVGFHYKLTFD